MAQHQQETHKTDLPRLLLQERTSQERRPQDRYTLPPRIMHRELREIPKEEWYAAAKAKQLSSDAELAIKVVMLNIPFGRCLLCHCLENKLYLLLF